MGKEELLEGGREEGSAREEGTCWLTFSLLLCLLQTFSDKICDAVSDAVVSLYILSFYILLSRASGARKGRRSDTSFRFGPLFTSSLHLLPSPPPPARRLSRPGPLVQGCLRDCRQDRVSPYLSSATASFFSRSLELVRFSEG